MALRDWDCSVPLLHSMLAACQNTQTLRYSLYEKRSSACAVLQPRTQCMIGNWGFTIICSFTVSLPHALFSLFKYPSICKKHAELSACVAVAFTWDSLPVDATLFVGQRVLSGTMSDHLLTTFPSLSYDI